MVSIQSEHWLYSDHVQLAFKVRTKVEEIKNIANHHLKCCICDPSPSALKGFKVQLIDDHYAAEF